MSIYLHTFDGHEVEAINDARLYKELTQNACGIVSGARVTAAGGLVLSITDGWGIVNGRLFTINAGTVNATPATSGTMIGAIYAHFNTSEDEPATILTAVGASVEAIRAQLTFDDITAGGIENNIILATYNVTTVAVDGAPTNVDPVSITPASAEDLAGYVPTTRTVNGNALSGNVTVTRDQITGIVKSNTTSSKTLNMSLSGTTLTITYQ